MKICWDNLEKVKYIKSKFYINDILFFESEEPCINCKEIFFKQNKKVKYCSRLCSNISLEARKNKSRSKIGEKNPFFGKKHTEEIRKKISENQSGKNNHFFGKNHTEEVKKRISKNNSGERSSQWRGGFYSRNEVSYKYYGELLENIHEIRNDNGILEVKCIYCDKWYKPTPINIMNRINSIYYEGMGGRNLYCSKECKQECPTYHKSKYPKGFKPSTSREVQPELRKLVFERDNWTCIKCKEVKNLHCHHIDPVVNNPLESADLDNCITLCKECHKDVHRKEGCRTNKLKCKE
jgi:hypothetical protein